MQDIKARNGVLEHTCRQLERANEKLRDGLSSKLAAQERVTARDRETYDRLKSVLA